MFQGAFTAVQGGNFWQGFAAGALSSVASSAWQGGSTTTEGFSQENNWAWGTKTISHAGLGAGTGTFGLVAFGTLAGAGGAALTGGNVWLGAATGFVVSFANHAAHPDGPGDPPRRSQKMTFRDAKFLYNNGGGCPVTVDINSLDLSKVSMSDFGKDGLASIKLDGKHFSNTNDALVHGTITLERIGNTNEVRVAYNRDLNGRGGMYNFEMHKWNSGQNVFIRNPATIAGFLINGIGNLGTQLNYVGGTPFPIFYSGTAKINK